MSSKTRLCVVGALLPSIVACTAASPDAGSDGKGAAVAKAEVKAEAKTDAKTDVKTDAKADTKADAKADTKADAKADTKADAKADSVAPGTPPPGGARSWHVVAQRKGALAMGQLVDGTVLVLSEAESSIAPPGQGLQPLAPIAGNDRPSAEGVERIVGRWPEQVFVIEGRHDMRAGATWKTWLLAGGGWREDTQTLQGVLVSVVGSATPWRSSSVLVRRTWRVDEQATPGDYADDEAELARAQKAYDAKMKKARAKAKATVTVEGAAAIAPPPSAASMSGELLSFASGELFGGCDGSGQVVRVAADGTTTTELVTALPAEALESAALIGRDASTVVCLRSTATELHTAVFDGKTWTSSQRSETRRLQGASMGGDGAVWAVLAADNGWNDGSGVAPESVLVRLSGGQWSDETPAAIALPGGGSADAIDPMQVVARTDGELWLTAVTPFDEEQGIGAATWVALRTSPADVVRFADAPPP
ncbi:MAG: hypothetical protein K1X88_14010 [Nannocystaceae bacterium]|nr:hypothetical protein [Nannocystaceae bacterium]